MDLHSVLKKIFEIVTSLHTDAVFCSIVIQILSLSYSVCELLVVNLEAM